MKWIILGIITIFAIGLWIYFTPEKKQPEVAPEAQVEKPILPSYEFIEENERGK